LSEVALAIVAGQMAENARPNEPSGASQAKAPGSVLMVTRRWARDGGVSTHVQTSAALLAREGVDVRVLVARIESDEQIEGVTVYRSPRLFQAAAPMEERIGEAMAFDPEIVHLHQVDLPEIVRAARTSAAVVVSAHVYSACTAGVYYFQPGQECTRGHGPGCAFNLVARGCAHARNPLRLPGRYRRATQRLEALREADLAVSYSSSVDRHLAANGLSRRRLVPISATIVPALGAGHATRRRVVFGGRVVREKGLDVFVRAAQEVDAEFVVCGDGPRLASTRKLAARLGVQDRVSFRGWLEPVELAQELADASVVVVPSLWPEPFGLVGIEALAAGRPVVASDTGGVRDWLDDGVSGLCVTPGDAHALARALNELLADPERQRQMGIAGREAVQRRFSPERHLAAIVDAYASASAHRSTTPRSVDLVVAPERH
jgi:glycosyltransferase involved in cell wall biosynthesis